jgi:hypothetical protein
MKLIRVDHCLQIEADFSVFVFLIEFGGVKGIPLLYPVLPFGRYSTF